MTYEKIKKELLDSPEKLMQKKPFYREVYETKGVSGCGFLSDRYLNDTITAEPTSMRVVPVSQDRFLLELNPDSHDVMFDENIPSITMKLKNGGWADLKFKRVAIPFQKLIKNKQVLHATGNPLNHTLLIENPKETQASSFILVKQYWKMRNQDGMFKKMVDTQKSMGDVGLLYYFDYKKQIKCRVLSYKDGYVICTHRDNNGDVILESVVYEKDNIKYIDSYDDKYMYRYKNDMNIAENEKNTENDGWVKEKPVPHGFDEIPLISKRGDVAWNAVQSAIDVYEVIYNVFLAIQKKHGWGVLYIKGNYDEKGKKLAGNIILNDTSFDGKGDAKFLTPPTPANTIETLQSIEDNIQKGAGTTFILPKDIRLSGDISGIAIALTMSLDIETAEQDRIDWQNVTCKMMRLFKFGLAKELYNKDKKKYKSVISDFEDIDIYSEIKVWRPMNEYEYNQMIQMMTQGGVLSFETGTELCTLSKPDEKARIAREEKAEEEKEQRKEKREFQIKGFTNAQNE